MADETLDLGLDDDPDGAFATPLVTDPAELLQQMVATVQENLPGWRAIVTAPEYQAMAGAAEVDADTNVALDSRLQALVLEVLGMLFKVPRLNGSPAYSSITVEAVDAAGHTLPAGSSVYVGETELVTSEDLVISAEQTSGTVEVRAVDPGADVNGATAEVSMDPLDWFAAGSPTLDAPLANGTDPEDDVAYSRRMQEELQVLSMRPITPPDLVVFATRHPQIAGAWAIKGYDADTGQTNKGRTATIVAYTDVGAGPPQDTLDAVRDDLVGRSVANAIVRVRAPTPVPINVTCAVVPYSGWDAGIVHGQVVAAIEAALSPLQWAQAPYQLDPGYVPSRIVHVNDLIAAVDQAGGVNRVTSMQIGNSSQPQITLTGPTELPAPGTTTVNVGSPDA
jgi:hypothetical protein